MEIPAGRHRCSPLLLRSGVHLLVAGGATLLAPTDTRVSGAEPGKKGSAGKQDGGKGEGAKGSRPSSP